jgi:hypothetical protein
MPCLASGACTMSGRGPGIAVPPGAAGGSQYNDPLVSHPTVRSIINFPPLCDKKIPFRKEECIQSSVIAVYFFQICSPRTKTKTFVTCDSRVVPHRSTEQAQGCLTSEFGWDPVLSPWYERMIRVDRGCGTRGVSAFGPLRPKSSPTGI